MKKEEILNQPRVEMKYETNIQQGKLLFESEYKGYQFYILSMGTHPTAYINIPENNKLYKKDYVDIYDNYIDLDVHGGLTYSEDYLIFDDKLLKGWFIGWDYAHWNDYLGFSITNIKGKKWTTKEIIEQCLTAIEEIYDIN